MKHIATILFGAASCLSSTSVNAFAPPSAVVSHQARSTTSLSSEVASAEAEADTIQTDPKEAVKLFGRLAEKYIMLDASAGMCCYSACSDCEYREPGGGYRMADQSSARPKWIPCYDERIFETQGKEHTTKWSTELFTEGPAVTKDQFVERLVNMDFAPPLGGPYLAASAAAIEDESAAATLFDILAGEKEKLTKFRMGKEMKVLSNGEEGLTWAMFSAAMGAK
mmetsp:Transcript_4134/g.9185  ORF Transcript_4134/g.9185 Transcript_4134/m.9185 type:complete len:224 (+) Transcript_4134:300-971(+)|eukprot:CAMPEP_0183702322 /NCGR_PEP_ID=MMETSP0737-20130205/465_1 /TAXON_ID=385413 /ORGANISM="Thalassiosira miniscula, Strain CCMP1093" /LENGTH=223 /DNA_ID=CAMNT_0025928913 /DNA_START=299 /DNA_END=970 /DNA_ORIENTATION=-